MTSSEVWDEQTAATYDEDAAEKFAPEVLEPTVGFLADLAGGGAALEFAVGTGRVAIPLADRGVDVTGIELSRPMVAQLRSKIDDGRLPVVVGDMATTTVAGAGDFALVYLVWNSISNLCTQAEQTQCFRNAAHHLRTGGRFAIELWVPPVRRLAPGHRVVPISVKDEHLIFDTYDLATQECSSEHYYRDASGRIRHQVGHFRFIWPSECDLMAELAGLTLEARYADWDRSPFTAESESHVSVWRKN